MSTELRIANDLNDVMLDLSMRYEERSTQLSDLERMLLQCLPETNLTFFEYIILEMQLEHKFSEALQFVKSVKH